MLNERIERVRIGEHRRRHDRIRRARVRLRANRRRATIQIQNANRALVVDDARDDAMKPARHVHRDAEPLPNAPLAEIAHENGRVVDEHGERTLHRDDDVAFVLERQMSFDGKDAVRRLVLRRDHARWLLRLQNLRRVGAKRIGRERVRPRAWFLCVEIFSAIGRAAVTERARVTRRSVRHPLVLTSY